MKFRLDNLNERKKLFKIMKWATCSIVRSHTDPLIITIAVDDKWDYSVRSMLAGVKKTELLDDKDTYGKVIS